jgi:thiol:disulfide interchange protein
MALLTVVDPVEVGVQSSGRLRDERNNQTRSLSKRLRGDRVPSLHKEEAIGVPRLLQLSIGLRLLFLAGLLPLVPLISFPFLAVVARRSAVNHHVVRRFVVLSLAAFR